jgi:steroid 5-alpha reductase family enzyme
MDKYLIVLLVLFTYYFIIFVLGQFLKDNSIVDIFWGLSFVVTAVFSLFYYGAGHPRQIIVTVLVALWGLRLTYHIAKRNIGKPEDFRYVNFRKKWGTKFVLLKAFLHVYMLQMLMSVLISIGFVMINTNSNPDLSYLDVMGLIIWLVGYYFEVIGDKQLKDFLANPDNRGKILTTGLYKYTRHPNYFGEATMWWGIFFIALNIDYGFIALISPVVITVLVRYVSGVPMLEKAFEDNLDFQEYAKHTSVFIPKFRK